MSQLMELTLGILTSMGGFVDAGELVFCAQAGARFRMQLLWVIVLGTIGIVVFGEMSGRVAAVTKLPVFTLVRQRLGFSGAFVTFVLSDLLNLLTCTAEIGAIAVILRLLTGMPYRFGVLLAALFLALVLWALPFKWIERTFGLLGLFMLTFLAATAMLRPDLNEVVAGLVPTVPVGASVNDGLMFAYFAVGLFSSILLPYEVYFYSSGAIEEHWKPRELTINRIVTGVGFSLGALLAMALIVNAAVVFQPRGVQPDLLGTTALQVAVPFGVTGVRLGLIGMLFAIAGAAIETCLSFAYNLCQFFGWEWGRYRGPAGAPRFTLAWLLLLAFAAAILQSGIDPVKLVESAVVFSIVVLPATYFPLLLVAQGPAMGDHRNGHLGNAFGWTYLVLITLAALAALPLYVLTRGGKL